MYNEVFNPCEHCKDCKYFNEDMNGFCEYYAKFKDERDEACFHYDENR